MPYETRLFINNEFVDSQDGKTFDVHNPVDDSHVATVQSAGPLDIEAAYTSASTAFRGPWRTMKNQERMSIMLKFADLLERDKDILTAAETECMGVPASFAPYIITTYAAPVWRYYAGWCDKLGGESYPMDADDMIKIVKNEPLGVCAAISAWNGTQLSVAWKLGPALAAGNTVIHKSSEKSPLGCLMLGKLVIEAGFPPGVINFVSGAGECGALLSSHMKIAKVSFTGSIPTGRRIQEAAAKSNLKRVTLELGGKSPSIVFNDADMENALAMNTQMFLINSGQACVAGSRVLVQEDIAETFIAGMKERFEQFTHAMGDPTDPKTFLGPVADKAQSDRIISHIEAGKAAGGEVLLGGGRKGGKGNYILPTIFLNPDTDNTIYKDEIFGPVLAIKTFKTEEEAIALANDTTYGLAAYCYTKDVSRALRMSDALEAGTVCINTTTMIHLPTPFGGYKQSGSGRESGKDGLMAYINRKTITIKI